MSATGIKRDAVIQTLERKAIEWPGKLDEQDGGKCARARGRKLSDGGACARFYHEVCAAHLARIVRVDLKSELFTYALDERALALARLMDGKLLLVTHTPDLTPSEMVERFKSLADIERGFSVLKSEIEIGPIHHWLPDRIHAHATICFIALILYRVMRTRLQAGDTRLSPERALSSAAPHSASPHHFERRPSHCGTFLNQPIKGRHPSRANICTRAGAATATSVWKPGTARPFAGTLTAPVNWARPAAALS